MGMFYIETYYVLKVEPLQIDFERWSDSGAWGRHWAQTEQPLCLWKYSLESREDYKLSDDWRRFESRSKETFVLLLVEAGLGIFVNKSSLPQRNAYLHQLLTKITCSSESG